MKFCFFKKKEKTIEKFLKGRAQEEQELLLLMFRYAEGGIFSEDILQGLHNNQQVGAMIFINRKIPLHLKNYEMSFLQEMLRKTSLSFSEKAELYRIILSYFKRQNIAGDYFNQETNILGLIISAFPQWVYPDEDYILSIIEREMPKDLNQEAQLVWCENKILSLYQYDKIPPEWIQDETWPIYNGLPMKFTHQVERNGQTVYYFIDAASGYKKSIIQND